MIYEVAMLPPPCVVGDWWAAWKFIPNWRVDGREMGWAETITVELIVLWIIHDSQVGNDCTVKVRSDNMGVIGAGNGGRSRNPHCNNSIRVATLLISSNTVLDFKHVKSADNRADPISRGELGPPDAHLKISFQLPEELQQFLVHV